MRVLAAVAVVLVGAALLGSRGPAEDPGVEACRQDASPAVGALAARSSVPELALSGVRLRDAGSVGEVEAASAQLERVCRAWSAR